MVTSFDRREARRLAALLVLLPVLATSACERDRAADGARAVELREAGDPPEQKAEAWAPGPPLARPEVPPGPPSSARPAEGAPPPADTPSSQDIGLEDLGFAFGRPDAPVRIVEFSDFGCGYCRQFHLETYPTLHEEYVETGKVYWRYVPYILGTFGPNAVDAALAGECAGEQNKEAFVAMRERLFADQAEWKRADDPAPHFLEYARDQGLNAARFASCMANARPQVRVVAGSQLGRRVGIRGTPTFFILDYTVIPGALPVETFRRVLDQVLAEAGAGQEDGGGG